MPRSIQLGFLSLFGMAAMALADSVVTFSELQYHPTAAQTGGEWIELKNQYAVNIDMSGWRLSDGVDFVFPAGTVIPAGGYLVVAANPAALQSASGLTGVLGPFSGQLSNSGERVALKNNSDRVMDEITYGTSGSWPSGADGGGPTLAKRGNHFPSTDAASWRTSATSNGTPGAENFPAFLPPVVTTVVALDASWKYLANGTDPGGTWKDEAFNDAAWSTSAAGFRLGSDALPAGVTANTALPSGPVTYYFRRAFTWNGSVPDTTLKLKLAVDDGAAAYLNGTELVRTNLPAGTLSTTTKATVTKHNAPVLQEFSVPSFALHGGTNVLAVEVHQAPALAQGTSMLYYEAAASPAAARLDGPYTIGSRIRVATSQQLTHLGVQDADAAVDANDPDGADGLTGYADDDGFLNGSTGIQVGLWNAAGTQLASATVVSSDPHFGGWRYKAVTPVTLTANTDYYLGARAGNGIEWFLDNGSGTAIFAPEAGVSLLQSTFATGGSLARPTNDGTLTIGRWGAANALLGAPSVLSVVGDTTDAVFAAQLIATETLPAIPSQQVVLNEVSTSGAELMNLGASTSTSGMLLARVTSSGVTTNPVPVQTLAAGGFLQVSLALANGDRLLLYASDGVTVLDSIDVKSTPRSRSPDGTGAWLRPTALTPGAANSVALNTAVVINEIMFHPPADSLFSAGTARAREWIELTNRSASPVDLSGWKFTSGISYTFPAGTTLAAGACIVVAENPAAITSVHGLPSNKVYGPWSGSLSNDGEEIILADAVGNPADTVHYAASGRWPEASDGGGSSLELRDANADNGVPEAWAASDESTKAGWQTFTWSGPNNPSQTSEPTLWHELNLLLADGPGEVLIDDVRVTDTTSNTNLIQNGDFSGGAAHWRLLGNHRTSRVEAEPGNPGNQVLHLIASGAGEYQGNQIESTFIGNQALVEGRTYEISLRARWLSGGGRLNTRLYFNRLPRTNVLAVTPNGGTPGAANSRAVANLGPTFANLAHAPVVPDPGQPVVLSVDAVDAHGLAAVDLKYSVAGGAWQSTPMTASGAHYSATLPGQAAGTIVQFYVEGRDALGAVSTFPALGTAARALYVVRDGQGGALPSLRLVMTTVDATFLHAPVNTLSNEFLRATVIAGGSDIYYDVGVRLKGSFVGRNVARVGFSLRFGPDKLFRGTYDKVSVDRSQHAVIGVSEILAQHVGTAAGAIPGMYNDLAYFIHPLGTYTSHAMLRLAGFDEIYLDSQFPNGRDGHMFEMEVLRWSLATVDGNPESPKQPGNESGGTGYASLELQDYGNDPEAYRWNQFQAMHRSDDDYTSIIAVEKLFSQSGATFATNAAQLLDLDSWLRTLAYQSLVGPADAAYTGGTVHNFRLYFRPNDARAMYLPWDWDSSWIRSTSASLIGGGNVAKVITSSSDLTRRYYAQLYDLIATKYNTSYMGTWTAHYGARSGQDFSSILSYIGARASYVLSQLPAGTAFSAVAGSVSSNGAMTITGTAAIAIAQIEVNGVLYTPVWSSNTAWGILVPLAEGNSALTIRGIDAHGAAVNGATATLNVNNPYLSGWPALKINEWLAENDGFSVDPADGHSDDWFEIYNPTASPVNLAGWTITDQSAAPLTVPSGWSIPAGGCLLIWADNEPAQNPATPGTGDGLHVNFKLSNEGESLQLSAPDGRVIDLLTFGEQHANHSEGRAPDGTAAITELTLPTPGGLNALTRITPIALGPNGASLRFTTTPGLRYTLQWSADLILWNAVAPEQIATGAELTITDPSPAEDKRFYRVRVSP
jgi:hypothetical protein